MSLGYISIVLHAHLPFVRHVDDPRPQKDDWLQEALIDCYLPLLMDWHKLLQDGVEYRLTLSLSPTLLAMLRDEYLQERCRERLLALIELGDKELDRTRKQPQVHSVVEMYRERLAEMKRFYIDRWGGDIIEAIKPLMSAGRLEVITTAATHGFLPGLRANENIVRGQIMVGLDAYAEAFGERPVGFWLPECAYYPDLDYKLEREGIRYFIVDSQGLLKSRPAPKFGNHAPVYTNSGLAAFARDPIASEQVWSSIIGYPGDVDYREFYRDIGYDLDFDYIEPYVAADGTRKDTGFKYYRITGPGNEKQIYHHDWAMAKVGLHSGHFLEMCKQRATELSHTMDRRPIIVAPFDAELFGHWWFEGPKWLDAFVRKISFDQQVVDLITPSDYLDRRPVNQVVELCPSTWGQGGHNEVWINGHNDYIYRHLHWAGSRMWELATARTDRRTIDFRAKKQAARELLLAQASDWPFMMHEGNTADYGHMRFREHMLNFIGLYRQIHNNRVDRKWLAQLERKDNIFPNLELGHFGR